MNSPIVTDQPPSTGDGGAALLSWLQRMRAAGTVTYSEQTGAVNVFGYAEAVRALSDPASFSSQLGHAGTGADPDVERFMSGNPLGADPPRHGKLRRLVSQAFTPRVVAEYEPRIAAIATALLDSVADKDEFDYVTELAYPLPVTVIAELLGIPASDQEMFRTWNEAMLSATYESPFDGQGTDVNIPEAVTKAMRELCEYVLGHVRSRRAHPRDDLITGLAMATVDGESLTDDEVVGFAAGMLLGGHMSTTMMLGNTVACLLEHPDDLAAVRADRSLLPAAVEEVLRFRSPTTLAARMVKKPTQLGGVDLPAGRLAVIWTLSGNHDERQFERPDVFDIRRSPNAHLTFGHGTHFCVGTQLARLEAKVSLGLLLDRYPEFAATAAPSYYNRFELCGVKQLPLSVSATARRPQ
ncbi:cytochrome P450 [Amycolatopsis sp. NPDC051716]|jgi:cytochrome P450|uniref:cytochrome P450 n=1 Tax=Amycolatopsis sp. NPDC051716 TaxID=3155804 RepID=UPI00344A167D